MSSQNLYIEGDTLDDYDTYNTIMKDKEWLLSFDCPLRFIFSHSAYRINVDTNLLVSLCVKDLRDMDPIPKARVVSQAADIHIESAGVSHTEREIRTLEIQEDYSVIPDVLTVIGEQTLSKRSTVRDILVQSNSVRDLLNNPQLFIEWCVEVIRNRRYELAMDGISYLKLAGQEYYMQEILTAKNLLPI